MACSSLRVVGGGSSDGFRFDDGWDSVDASDVVVDGGFVVVVRPMSFAHAKQRPKWMPLAIY